MSLHTTLLRERRERVALQSPERKALLPSLNLMEMLVSLSKPFPFKRMGKKRYVIVGVIQRPQLLARGYFVDVHF